MCWGLGEGAEEAIDSYCRDNSLHKNCQQYWTQDYFCKAPSINFFPDSWAYSDHFWLILKTTLGKDLKLWKTNHPTYSRTTKKELNACMHARARAHTHTHSLSLSLTPQNHTVNSEAVNYTWWSLEFHLSDLLLMLFTDVKQLVWVRNIPSSYSLVHLQCTSSWHFQSGLALSKTISCFALKKWITWNGNLAAKPWKIVPGPNICPKWAQLRSPWEGWVSRESLKGKWRQWTGRLSSPGKSLVTNGIE